MSDPSALALPDTPELPAEIKEAIRQLEYAAISFGETPDGPSYAPTEKLLEVAVSSVRSVIAKHLLTAQDIRWLTSWGPEFFGENMALYDKLTRLTPRLTFPDDEMRCAQCSKQTPHRLFGDVWRCSECGGVSSTCAQMPCRRLSGSSRGEE